MPLPHLIAPSILSADFARLGEQIKEAENAGADWLHIDVMDGHFVPNISLGPLIVEACKRITSLPLDVHLMIEQPDRYLESFAKAGADHISVHVEAEGELLATLQRIKGLGCLAGVAIKPQSKIESIREALDIADIALVMSVEPGFGGQDFMPEVLSKVISIRKIFDGFGSKGLIEIDGGMDGQSISLAKDAGVNIFVAGSSIFGHSEGIEAGILSLRKAIQ